MGEVHQKTVFACVFVESAAAEKRAEAEAEQAVKTTQTLLNLKIKFRH